MALYQIRDFAHQRQLNPRACWYTCMQMMVRHFESQQQASLADLSGPQYVPTMKARFDRGSNPSWAEWRQWAEQLGFTALNLTPNEFGILAALQKHGPIMYSGTWGATFDGHVVVITGVDTAGPTVYVHDPLEARAPVAKPMYGYMERLAQTLWENPLFVYG